MKYAQIAALVPAGEHFDETAVINEGGYLSVAHIAAIDSRLAENASAIANHATVVEGLNGKITEETTAREAAEGSLATANTTISDQATTITDQTTSINDLNTAIGEKDAEIERLKAENVKLKKPAGEFQNTSREEDEPPVGGKKKAFHESDSNPFNRIADGLMPHKA